jgi:hypothetical protein
MAVYLGSKEIKRLNFGNKEVKEAYLGGKKVFGSEDPF